MRSISILVLTTLGTFVHLAGSAHAGESAADISYGKNAVQEFNTAFAALNNKEVSVEELHQGVKAASDCGVDLHTLIGLEENSAHTNSPRLYDPDKETLPTAAGKLTLTQVQDRCKQMEDQLKTRKVVGCGTKAVSVQQEKLLHNQWTRVEDNVNDYFKHESCASMPKKHAFPGGSKAFESRFRKLCGKGAIYVIEDASWSIWERDGHVYRSYSGACWEKGVTFGS